MLLSDWIHRERITRSEFASRVGLSPATISDLCQGNQWLSRKTAKAIEQATGGEVTAADFVHIEPPEGPPEPASQASAA